MKRKILLTIFVASLFTFSCSNESSQKSNSKAVDSSTTTEAAKNKKVFDNSPKAEAAKADQSSLTQMIFGPPEKTHGLHNTDCVSCNSAPFTHGCFDHFCFGKHTLTVSAPSGWTFTGTPFVNCVENNEGSFEWNNFAGAPDRFKIIQRSPNNIQAEVWAGSREIRISLACEATKN